MSRPPREIIVAYVHDGMVSLVAHIRHPAAPGDTFLRGELLGVIAHQSFAIRRLGRSDMRLESPAIAEPIQLDRVVYERPRGVQERVA